MMLSWTRVRAANCVCCFEVPFDLHINKLLHLWVDSLAGENECFKWIDIRDGMYIITYDYFYDYGVDR